MNFFLSETSLNIIHIYNSPSDKGVHCRSQFLNQFNIAQVICEIVILVSMLMCE
jgi:hypothetical protein